MWQEYIAMCVETTCVVRRKNIPFDLFPSGVFTFYVCLFELVGIMHIFSYPYNPMFLVVVDLFCG